jgi:hypothetical protein
MRPDQTRPDQTRRDKTRRDQKGETHRKLKCVIITINLNDPIKMLEKKEDKTGKEERRKITRRKRRGRIKKEDKRR